MTARGDEQIDLLLRRLGQAAESQLQECKGYFGPKYHEMQEKLNTFLSGMNNWTEEFPHVIMISHGRGHTTVANKMVLRHHRAVEGANKETPPCDLGGIGRIPVRHDFFTKLEPIILPIGGHVPDYDTRSREAMCERGPSQKSARHPGQKDNVGVYELLPPIRDCHVVLEKIPKRKLQKFVGLHVEDFDEASSYCSESSHDSDYIPLQADDDCPSSDGGEEDAGEPSLHENYLFQRTKDSSSHQARDRRDARAHMYSTVSSCSKGNEAGTFFADDSAQQSRANCMNEEMASDQQVDDSTMAVSSSPSTGVLSGPGEFGPVSDNDSLPDNMADSDVCTEQSPPNSPSLLAHSGDRQHCTVDTVPGNVSVSADIGCTHTPKVSDIESDVKVNEDITSMEVTTDVTNDEATAEIVGAEVNEDITDTMASRGKEVTGDITDLVGSEISPASSGDDLLLFSQHKSMYESPLPGDLARSTPAVDSLTASVGMSEDVRSHLSKDWQGSHEGSCTSPLSNLRDCTQSSPELMGNHLDTSGDLFTLDSSHADDCQLRISLLSSQSGAEGDTLLSPSAVVNSSFPSPATVCDIKKEHSYVCYTQPVGSAEADLNDSSLSSRSAPPDIGGRRGKSMRLLKRRRLLSSPVSPPEPSLSGDVKSKNESQTTPTTPNAKRACIQSEEDTLEDRPPVQAEGQTSDTCKALEEAMDQDESPNASFKQQEEECCSSASVVPGNPLRGNAADHVEGKGEAKSAAKVEKDGPNVSPTTGQTPFSRRKMVRGRKFRHGSCIACGKNFMLNADPKVAKHPKLDAFMCSVCHGFYFSGEFTMSGDKQNECFVCGEGGKVVECDTPGDLCPHSVCLKCVKRLEGPVKVKSLQTDKELPFFCYECDPGPIQHLLSAFKCGSLTLGWKVNEEEEEEQQVVKNEPLDKDRVGSPQKSGQSSPSDKQKKGISADTSSNAAEKHEDATKDTGEGQQKKGHDISRESDCGSHSSYLDSASSSDTQLSSDDDLPNAQFCTKMSSSKEESSKGRDRDSSRTTSATEKLDGSGDSAKERRSKQRKQDKTAITRQSFTNRHAWRKGSSSGTGSESESEIERHEREILREVDEEGDERGLEDEMQAETPKNDNESVGKKTSGKKRSKRFLSDTSSEDELPQPRIELLVKPEGEPQGETMYDEVPEVKYSTKRAVACKVVFSDSEEDDFCKQKIKPKVAPLEEKESTEEDEVDKNKMDEILTDAQKKTKDKKKGRRKRRVPKGRYMILDSDFEDSEGADGGDNSIIILSDDSDTDKEQEAETPPSQRKDAHARRNIRKIMSKQKLTALTKQAQKEEQDRQKRLKERGELDLSGDRLILEGTTEEPVFEVRRSLVPWLKPHQRDGVRFLWDYTCESVEKIKDCAGSGALLAHCMGLGKTLQVIAFLDALLHSDATDLKRMLVIVPKNTISNWVDEFQRWLNDENDYYVVNFNQYKSKYDQLQVIESWHLRGGVGIISYDTYRILTSVKAKRTARQCERLRTCLRDPGPDIVVCDEGHVLRNCKSALSQAVNQVATQRRIVLTGTPLQNNLQEYYTMVSFVKPNLLGTMKEFNNRFGNPIRNGQCRDAKSYDVVLMKRRAHVLNRLLSGCVQRKDYRVLTECLPSKHEYIMKIRLSPQQEQLYCTILEQRRGSDGVIQSIFKFFQVMLRIWNHPWMLRLYEERMEADDDDDSGSDLGGFICDDSEADEEVAEIERRAKAKKKTQCKSVKRGSSRSSNSTSSSPSISIPASPSFMVPTKGSGEVMADPSAVGTCSGGPSLMSGLVPVISVNSSSGDPVTVDLTGGSEGKPHDVCEPEGKPQGFWYDKLLTDEMENMIELSGKMLFLRELLVETKRLGEKVLVFSQSLLTLDIIEHFLCQEEFGSLTPDLDYFRLDGATGAGDRATMTRSFNCNKEKRVRLFLISTRAGSLGINLVSANRVVIFDACWNPSHDLQALFRVYRYGQTKPVFIYRLIAKGTMEEKIYDRQVTKEAIALRVVDKKQIDRHFSNADLSELLVYTPAPPPQDMVGQERPEADPLLCGILDKLQPKWLLSYHCHDSLLVHREFEELSQTDKDSAWEEYLSSVREVEGQAYYAAAGMPEQQGVQFPTTVGSAAFGVPVGQQSVYPQQQQWGPGMLLPPSAVQQQLPQPLPPTSTMLSQMPSVPSSTHLRMSHDFRLLRATSQSIKQIFQQRDIDSDLVRLGSLITQHNQPLMVQLREQIVKKLNERDHILRKISERLQGVSAMGPSVTSSPEFKDIQETVARASAALHAYSTMLQRLMPT